MSDTVEQFLIQAACIKCTAANYEQEAAEIVLRNEKEKNRPFILLRPKIYPDGNMWCVLYGDNLQEGVAGFGKTPQLASIDFDGNWLNFELLRNEQK